jgi:hypothetical protein
MPTTCSRLASPISLIHIFIGAPRNHLPAAHLPANQRWERRKKKEGRGGRRMGEELVWLLRDYSEFVSFNNYEKNYLLAPDAGAFPREHEINRRYQQVPTRFLAIG